MTGLRITTVVFFYAILLGSTRAEFQPPPVGISPAPTTMEPPLAQGSAPSPTAPSNPIQLAPPGPLSNPQLPQPIVNDPPSPQVTVQLRVKGEVTPGQELEYKITVRNLGGGPAHHVWVWANLPTNSRFLRGIPDVKQVDTPPQQPFPALRPANTNPRQETFLVWDLGTLDRNANKDLYFFVVPDGKGDVQCCARVRSEHGECVQTRLTKPELRVKFHGPDKVMLNDTNIRYRVEVSNLGRRDASNVELRCTLPEGLTFLNSKPPLPGKNPLTWNLGTLPMGKTVEVEYQVMADKTGILTTRAEVQDSEGARSQTSFPVNCGESKLTLNMTGPQQRILGRPVTYQLTASNTGTRPVNQVVILYDLPAREQIKFINATQGGQLQGNKVRWALGTIAPGARQAVQLTLEATQAGDLINLAVARDDRGVETKATAKTRFLGAAGLAMEIEQGRNPLEVGRDGIFTIVVTNRGNAPAKAVEATVAIPADLAIIDNPNGKLDEKTNEIVFPVGQLDPSQSKTFKLTLKGSKAGDSRLVGKLKADEIAPIQFEESVILYSDTAP